uniref:Uncharacterized protein n=1 Tax=Panagrolaimus sp. JU765 TaxID=591449 RepID=A0AC34R9P0_9BILA
MEYLKEHPEMVKTVKNQTIVTSNFEDRENKQPYQTMQSLTYSMQRIQLKSPTRYKVPISVAIDAVVGDANDGSPIRRNNVKRNRERSYVEEVDSSEDEDEEESNEEDESESVEEGYEDEEDDESDDESFRAEYSRPPDQFNEDDHIFSSTVQQSRPKKQNVASRLEKARRR